MTTQVHDPQNHRQRPPIFVFIIVLMVIGGASLWILNIQGIVPGPWSSILGVIFTSLGVLLALFQWHFLNTSETSQASAPLPPALHQQRRHAKKESFHLDVNRRRGALIVKVRKNFLGVTVYLCRGFEDVGQKPDAASNVIERKIDGHYIFAAVFPFLEPGNYTVYLNSQEYVSKVTVYGNLIVEVDWRLRPPLSK